MKMQDAIKIIDDAEKQGFMVSFEHAKGGMLLGDYFPDKHAGEKLIESEEIAWLLARQFAAKTRGKCVNIYVVDANFNPVKGYRERTIKNR